jgi:hypothetical protein
VLVVSPSVCRRGRNLIPFNLWFAGLPESKNLLAILWIAEFPGCSGVADGVMERNAALSVSAGDDYFLNILG